MLCPEGAIEAHLHQPHLLSLLDQPRYHFLTGANGGTHQHQHPLGLRMTHVFERLVVTAGLLAEGLHRLAHVTVSVVIPGVGGLPALEIGVRVGSGAAHDGVIRAQGAVAVGTNGRLRQQGTQGVVRQRHYLGDLVGGTKTVEEVDEGHPAVEAGDLGDQGEVLRLLHVAGAEHGAAGLAHRHHVRVIAEDGQGMGRDGARRHVEHEGDELTRQLVEVGDHQQQALGRGKGGRQRAGLQGAVDGGDGPALRLHLDNSRHVTPQVQAPIARPGRRLLCHAGARGDGVDGDDFAGAVGH
ncbi:hypothetical protein D3C85_997500 [compost metagenome]